MRTRPRLTLVDPDARPRTDLRQRLLPIALGTGIAVACAVPYLLALPR